MIPLTFRFCYYRGQKDFLWRDLHTLCLQSCKMFAGAHRIIVHYDVEGEGPNWDEARALPGIEWSQESFVTTINGLPVTDQRIVCDLFRLKTLDTEGGFFCDLDFVFLKSFESIRHDQAVIGIQCKAKSKLCCALMGAVPGSAFIKAYIDSYKDWTLMDQKKFWTYANIIPWNLAKSHPVTILNRPAFYPWCWSNKTFLRGEKINLKASLAIHLWETLNPNLTVEDLKKTTLGPVIQEIMGLPTQTSVQVQPGGLLQF